MQLPCPTHIEQDEHKTDTQGERSRPIGQRPQSFPAREQDTEAEHAHILQIVGRLQTNHTKQPNPMILRADLPNEMRANTHQQRHPHQRAKRPGESGCLREPDPTATKGSIDQAETEQCLYKPHRSQLQFSHH